MEPNAVQSPGVVSPARNIERVMVDSSSLQSIGYDAERQILVVEFKPKTAEEPQVGTVFFYNGVPADVVERLGQAKSMGQFYAAEIKGKYPSQVMTGKCRCGEPGYIGERCQCGDIVLQIERRRKDCGCD